MIEQPVLETPRLRLRPLERSDASAIQSAASIRELADTMISLPHPYPAGEAVAYIDRRLAEREAETSVTFTIARKTAGIFCGLIELREIELEHLQGELSFWLVVDAWGRGYMTESVQAVTHYGFEPLGLNRLYAYHMLRNPATGRVLKKSGFQREGILRQRVRKWGQFEDVALWAVLRKDVREPPISV